MNASPVLKAFVLADHIYTDAETGKRVIAGTFSNIWAAKFPSMHVPCHAFIVLTEFVGRASLQLRYVRLSDNRVLMQSGKVEIECDDALAALDLAMAIPGIPLPEPGDYGFECYVADSLIGIVRVRVVSAAGKGPQ